MPRSREGQRRERIARNWTLAYYPGICAQCERPFGANALVEYASFYGGWRSTCCAPPAYRDLLQTMSDA
jgi:hypothetical protein